MHHVSECMKKAKGQRPEAGRNEKPEKGGGKGQDKGQRNASWARVLTTSLRLCKRGCRLLPSPPLPAGDGSAHPCKVPHRLRLRVQETDLHPRNGRRDPRKDILSGDPREDILSGLPHLSSSAP